MDKTFGPYSIQQGSNLGILSSLVLEYQLTDSLAFGSIPRANIYGSNNDSDKITLAENVVLNESSTILDIANNVKSSGETVFDIWLTINSYEQFVRFRDIALIVKEIKDIPVRTGV